MKKRIVAFFLCCVMVFQNVYISYASGLVIPAVEAIGAEEGLAILLSCLGFSLGDDFASRDAAREKYIETMSKADFTIIEGGGGNAQKPTNQFKEFCSNIAKGIGGTATIGKELWQATLDFVNDNYSYDSSGGSSDAATLLAENLWQGYHEYPLSLIDSQYMDGYAKGLTYLAENGYSVLAICVKSNKKFEMYYDKAENAQFYRIERWELNHGASWGYRLVNDNTHRHSQINVLGQPIGGLSDEQYSTNAEYYMRINPDVKIDDSINVNVDDKTLLYPSEELKKYLDKFGTGAIQKQDVINNNYYVTNEGLKNATRTIEVPADYQELLDNFKSGTLSYPDLMDNYNATSVMKTNDTNGDGKVDSNDKVGSDAKKMEPDFNKPLNGVDNDSKKMVYDLSSFFPFCIPFDFVDLLKAFSAPAQTPKFHYCIKIEKFNVDWNIDLDLTDFNTLAYWCRVFETIIFIFILMKLTSKLIKW